jgi:subtilisin family serine protease
MDPLELVQLRTLMERSQGRPEIAVGLIDGPVALDHPDLSGANIREISARVGAPCLQPTSVACMHGTFVAGILAARRGGPAPAICPGCTLIVRPIFAETGHADGPIPRARPEELADAIVDVVDAGASVINLSAALDRSSSDAERRLTESLDYAARRSVLLVASAGNQGTVCSSTITRHPWVIPVVACDLQGRPTAQSNLGSSIGRRGLKAPGEYITSLGTDGKPRTLSGTSAAAPFVTGAIALLLSEFPGDRVVEVKSAITRYGRRLSATIVPPLLDARAAYQLLAHNGRNAA